MCLDNYHEPRDLLEQAEFNYRVSFFGLIHKTENSIEEHITARKNYKAALKAEIKRLRKAIEEVDSEHMETDEKCDEYD